VLDDNAIIRNSDTIRDVLRGACNRSEIAILVTPYARFEANFLWLDQDIVHVTATMSKEDAQYGLRSPSLKVRFPYGHRILSAGISLLGVGMARGRRSLKLSVPAFLENDDYRRSYRVDKVGRVGVTFSSRKYELLTGKLVNLSTGGARVFSSRDFEEGEIQRDDTIHISIPLTPDISINTQAKVRHVTERTLGLEFRPQPEGKLLDKLAKWAFQKREEALLHLADQEAEGLAGSIDPNAPLVPEGNTPLIALIGGSPELELQLQALLKGLPPVRRFPANVQTTKALAAFPNTLAIFHIESSAHDVRKRARLLLDQLQGRVPFVLLGTGLEGSALQDMANEWKAAASYSFGTAGNVLLPRMVGGIFRKQFNVTTPS
jgi:hypothetical protein